MYWLVFFVVIEFRLHRVFVVFISHLHLLQERHFNYIFRHNIKSRSVSIPRRGTGGREPRRVGGGRKKGGKRDSQSGGNRKKRRKISQYCVTFHYRNRTKRREPVRKGEGSGSKRYERREFQTPCLSPLSRSSFGDHKFFKPITKRSNARPKQMQIMFDTKKTVLSENKFTISVSFCHFETALV